MDIELALVVPAETGREGFRRLAIAAGWAAEQAGQAPTRGEVEFRVELEGVGRASGHGALGGLRPPLETGAMRLRRWAPACEVHRNSAAGAAIGLHHGHALHETPVGVTEPGLEVRGCQELAIIAQEGPLHGTVVAHVARFGIGA